MRSAFCCILCLGIVYAAILRHDGYLVDPKSLIGPESLAAAARMVPQQVGKSIAAAAAPQIVAYCRRDADACLAGAAALARPLGAAAPARLRTRGAGVLGQATP